MNTMMASIAGYAASVWAYRLLLIKPKENIRKAQRGVLVRLSGGFATTVFEALAVTMDVLPLNLEIRRRAAQYWLRMNELDRVQRKKRNIRDNI